jgi:nicotinate-nucleotide adenylyltransferase
MTDVAEAVGFLGGTFDPVHLGHLAIAEEVRSRLALSRVLLAPTAVPPHKTAGRLSPADVREAMLRLALRGRVGLELCTLELRRDVCYTIDTLRRLRDGDPSLRPLLVLGTDALAQIHTWRDYRELLEEFDVVVADRAGQELQRVRPDLESAIADRIVDLPAREDGAGGRIYRLPFEPIAVSSSAIRRRASRGESLAGLVPPAVAEYIDRTALYRRENAR